MKSTKKNKTVMVLMRMSPKDRKRFKELCKKHGMPYGPWVVNQINKYDKTNHGGIVDGVID